jgi:hypothetical protein
MPAQVDQLASHLDGRQAEEGTRRRGLYRLQCSQQPEQGALKHIVSLRPAVHSRKAMQHLSRQLFESPGRATDQFFQGTCVARVQASQ